MGILPAAQLQMFNFNIYNISIYNILRKDNMIASLRIL